MSLKLENIKKGDLLIYANCVQVLNITRKDDNDVILVKDVHSDRNIEVRGRSLIETGSSADFFDVEERVSKTKVAEILISTNGKPFMVNFMKKEGEDRTLRGRFVSQETLLGRSMVEDLDVKEKHKFRLVDHRTLKWLIFGGTKYTVK